MRSNIARLTIISDGNIALGGTCDGQEKVSLSLYCQARPLLESSSVTTWRAWSILPSSSTVPVSSNRDLLVL